MSTVRPVYVCGGQISAFGRFDELSLVDLAVPIVHRTLNLAGLDARDINAAFVGNSFGGLLQGQESILGQVLMHAAGIRQLAVHNVKNACSSGSDAVHLAWSSIAYGQYDCVLVLGVEKMTHSDRRQTFAALASVSDRAPENLDRSVFMDLNAERSKRYMSAYGATARHFAMGVVKNRSHAILNPRAAIRQEVTVEEVLNDRVIASPLTRAMCGGISDGSAALLLVSESFARQKGLKGSRMLASVVAGGDSARGELPTVTARCAEAAFNQAGIAPQEISLAEVHDPTAPQELFDIEDIGLCSRGEAFRLLEDGELSLGGRLPVNTSGGLIARGHPVAATGVAQIVEICEQLEGRAGQAQLELPKFGLAQMAGGLVGDDSAVATVHILSR